MSGKHTEQQPPEQEVDTAENVCFSPEFDDVAEEETKKTTNSKNTRQVVRVLVYTDDNAIVIYSDNSREVMSSKEAAKKADPSVIEYK